MLPQHLFLRDVPRLSLVIISLVEEIGASVYIRKQMRMTRLTAVPLSGLTVSLERLCRESLPVNAIATHGYPDLLRGIVV